jgi:hypothetical protein
MHLCAPKTADPAETNRIGFLSWFCPNRSSKPYLAPLAEGEGFEPSRRLSTSAGFQDRCIQPLCHPSGVNELLMLDVKAHDLDRLE